MEASKTKGIGGHARPNRGFSDDWITPREIVEALGLFDLDPCQCVPQPWPCARRSYSVPENGLMLPWSGRVWLNPPYGPETAKWLERMACHNHGTALIFARTETEMFCRFVWRRASAVLFIAGRLYFYTPSGERAPGNSGGPSVLVAYGDRDADRLRGCGISGAFMEGWKCL